MFPLFLSILFPFLSFFFRSDCSLDKCFLILNSSSQFYFETFVTRLSSLLSFFLSYRLSHLFRAFYFLSISFFPSPQFPSFILFYFPITHISLPQTWNTRNQLPRCEPRTLLKRPLVPDLGLKQRPSLSSFFEPSVFLLIFYIHTRLIGSGFRQQLPPQKITTDAQRNLNLINSVEIGCQ